MPPQRLGILQRFGLKTGIDFAYFGLESGMVLEGTTGVYWTYLSFQFQMTKKERKMCQFEMDFKKSFLLLFLSK